MNDLGQFNKVVSLTNNDVLPNRFQPRKYFDEEEILQLSESIKEHGVINPIIVRKLGDKYELVAGERRYKANILAGNDSIPAIIVDVNDKESSEIAVVENIQRKDLNAVEEAISYKRILDIGYMTQEQLAKKMGKSQSAIANKIRLLKLSDEVQDALMKKQISERHARSLLKLKSQIKQNEMLKRIIEERLTVRKTDEEIDKMNNNVYNENSTVLTPIMPNSTFTDVNISNIPQTTNVSSNQLNESSNFISSPTIGSSNPEIIPSTPNLNAIEEIASVVPQPIMPTVEPAMGMPNLNPIEEVAPVAPQPIMPTVEPTIGISNLNPIEEVAPVAPQPIMPTVEPAMGMPNLNSNDQTAPFSFTQASNPLSTGLDQSLNKNISNYQGDEELQNLFQNNIQNENQNNSFNAKLMDDNILKTNNQQHNMNSSNAEFTLKTSPIIDTTMENEVNNLSDLNNLDNQKLEQNHQQFESIPEPIIVNDYNQQFDPIMPDNQNQTPTIDFKTIIGLIRKCSSAIENSGYKIDTEEYNLDNIYQVVFKIEKK